MAGDAVYSESVEAVARPQPSHRRRWALRVFTPTAAARTRRGAPALRRSRSSSSRRSDYIFLPDRAHPVAPLVRVAGGTRHDRAGGIYFVDVIVRKATLLEQIFGGLHSGADLYPADEVVPPGVSSPQEDKVNVCRDGDRRSRSRRRSRCARSARR